MRGVTGKRPRGNVAEQASPWPGRVPKPAMDADSLVDYGSGFLRKSCDSCVSSKRRCDGQDPCTRCQRRKKPCHYTERKKCGPRSGQKANKGARRTRPIPPPQAAMGHQALTVPHNVPEAASVTVIAPNSRFGGDSLEWKYPGLRLGPPPPVHAAPTTPYDELSGDSTGVDYTDVSDAPSQRLLRRDGSGSSWWSLEEQQQQQQQQQQQHHQVVSPPSDAAAAVATVTWNVAQTHHGPHNYPPHYPCQPRSNNVVGEAASWVPRRGDRKCRGGIQGVVPGSSGGSHGSEGDSFEDDTSDEGLGQTEEEVAALLVRLGQSRTGMDDVSEEAGAPHASKDYRMCSMGWQQQRPLADGVVYGRSS